MTPTVNLQRSVLVTGTSSGIGRATALLLARSGFRVFAGVRKESDALSLRSEAGETLNPLLLDITQPHQISAALEELQKGLGSEGLFALVNNAGIAEAGPLEYISIERVRRQFEVNVFGHLAMTQAVLPLIRKGSGRIITVASAVVDSPLPFLGPYCASKSATYALFLAMRRELRWHGIPVSLILPGFVAGPIWDSAKAAMSHIDQEDVHGHYSEIVRPLYSVLEPTQKIAVSPSVVARTILKALRANRPRATYRCGPGSQTGWLGNWVPEFMVHAGLQWYVKQQRRKLGTSFTAQVDPAAQHKE